MMMMMMMMMMTMMTTMMTAIFMMIMTMIINKRLDFRYGYHPRFPNEDDDCNMGGVRRISPTFVN
jgi:hypothetical protein